jgi:hypothetical protein
VDERELFTKQVSMLRPIIVIRNIQQPVRDLPRRIVLTEGY